MSKNFFPRWAGVVLSYLSVRRIPPRRLNTPPASLNLSPRNNVNKPTEAHPQHVYNSSLTRLQHPSPPPARPDPTATAFHLAPPHGPAAGLTNAGGGGTPQSFSPHPPTAMNPPSRRQIVQSGRPHAMSSAPHISPPPVSPTPAADALHSLSTPTPPPQPTPRTAAGLYTAACGTPCPQRDRHPRRRAHQRQRRRYSTILLSQHPRRHSSAEPPPACTQPAASRLVLSATDTRATGLTNAGGGCTPLSLSSDPPTAINPQRRRRVLHSRRRHALS